MWIVATAKRVRLTGLQIQIGAVVLFAGHVVVPKDRFIRAIHFGITIATNVGFAVRQEDHQIQPFGRRFVLEIFDGPIEGGIEIRVPVVQIVHFVDLVVADRRAQFLFDVLHQIMVVGITGSPKFVVERWPHAVRFGIGLEGDQFDFRVGVVQGFALRDAFQQILDRNDLRIQNRVALTVTVDVADIDFGTERLLVRRVGQIDHQRDVQIFAIQIGFGANRRCHRREVGRLRRRRWTFARRFRWFVRAILGTIFDLEQIAVFVSKHAVSVGRAVGEVFRDVRRFPR
jgi:hypothetical protein